MSATPSDEANRCKAARPIFRAKLSVRISATQASMLDLIGFAPGVDHDHGINDSQFSLDQGLRR